VIRCSICSHPNVAHLDALIASGQSVNSISRAMNVGADSLQRHVRNGHASRPGKASIPMPKLSNGTVDPMEDLRQQLVALDAIAATSTSQQLQVLEARRRVISEMARIAPPVADIEGPSAKALRVLRAMFDIQNEVISRHPDIRDEMAEALRQWKASRNGAEEVA